MQYVFSVISLLGGLAMFLYGMRLMGNNLKEGSSGTLKVVMSKVTDSYIKAWNSGHCNHSVIYGDDRYHIRSCGGRHHNA